MTLPHRIFTDLISRVVEGHTDNNNFTTLADFTNAHIIGGHWGWFYEDTVMPDRSYWKWFVICKSLSTDLPDSLDEILDYGVFLTMSVNNNNENCGQYRLNSNTMRAPVSPNTWNKDLCTGKRYDGVNVWGEYPPGRGWWGLYPPTLQWANAPHSLELWINSFSAGPKGNVYGPDFMRIGIQFDIAGIANCDNPWASGDILDGNLDIQKFKVNYLNPVVNSISRRWIKTGTSPIITLTGLAFDQNDVELNDPARNPLNAVGAVWNSIVDFIYLIGEQGQGTFTLSRVAGDFIVDSDTQIRLVNIPTNLPEGTYQIRLFKNNVGPGGSIDVYAYAGDWRAGGDGLCLSGSRMILLVQQDPPGNDAIILITKWIFKIGNILVNKFYAPMDIRSTNRFYDGRIITHSALTKSVDDETGLPNISDITIDLANADKEFSNLLATHTIKNQIVELFTVWKHEPETWKEYIMRMIVDDWEMHGAIWRVTLKDISQKYFRITIPRYIITLDEYPNAHESAVGKPMQEIIGRAYLDGELKGAVEAYLVDDPNNQYLAARASLNSITEVYSENILQIEGAGNDYTISYEDGGRTYINFNADQGDNKITFNCTGYMLADWNSANGYVQNPVYVIAFFISLIAEVPIDFIDMASFNDLADLMVDLGWDESGYLIIQDFQDMSTVLSELLFTYGAKIFPDNWGRFKIDRKDRQTLTANIKLYDQIDAMESTRYPQNLRELANRVKAKWQHYPCQSLFLGTAEDIRESSIKTFDVETEPEQSPWEFKWTTLEAVVISRINDELLKLGFGNKKAELSVSIKHVQELHVLDNFQLQDLFAISLSGLGAVGHYYYIDRLSLDFVNGKIDITAPDLQWLVRQCMIIGKCSELEEQWPDASDFMRIYGYIANCIDEEFSDGEPPKKICLCI